MLSCTIALPEGYRRQDILNFHSRDPQAVAESVEGATLRKGLAWEGRPACLTIRFAERQAEVELTLDGAHAGGASDLLESMVRRMLGLTQNIEQFEQRYREHPQLGPLIARHPGLRVPVAASPFEALTWAVTGQQVSLSAAISLRRRLIQVAGLKHSGGLACYPDAGSMANLNIEDLRQAGFSQTKARTLCTLGHMVRENQLPLQAWVAEATPVDEIRTRLLEVRGVGPWTVNYALLRGFGWLDGSLEGDAAVRRSLERLSGANEKITEEEARNWLAAFAPWRALVAAHLWVTDKP